MSVPLPPPSEDEEKKGIILFGRDIQTIPCFRSSFLYGIGTGIGVGTLTFLGTSRTRFATHVGFSSFFCTTLLYWFTCRYNYSKTKFKYNQLQAAMRNQALYEGTDRDINKNLDEA